MDDNDDFDAEEFDRACERTAEAPRGSAEELRRLQSAFVVLGHELREMIDSHPRNFNRETPAKQIGEAALSRAKSQKA